MVIRRTDADTNHPETEHDVCRAGGGWSQPRARAQSKSSDKHECEIGAHVPEMWDAKACSTVRERVIGRILGDGRNTACCSDCPHCHRAKDPLAPVLSAHVYEDPWYEAHVSCRQVDPNEHSPWLQRCLLRTASRGVYPCDPRLRWVTPTQRGTATISVTPAHCVRWLALHSRSAAYAVHAAVTSCGAACIGWSNVPM